MFGGPDGPVVGTITRKFTKLTQILDKDKYWYDLTVAPGVDFTMLVLLCDCLDETEIARGSLLS